MQSNISKLSESLGRNSTPAPWFPCGGGGCALEARSESRHPPSRGRQHRPHQPQPGRPACPVGAPSLPALQAAPARPGRVLTGREPRDPGNLAGDFSSEHCKVLLVAFEVGRHGSLEMVGWSRGLARRELTKGAGPQRRDPGKKPPQHSGDRGHLPAQSLPGCSSQSLSPGN